MAIKAGTDNKRNVIIAVALFCVLGYLAVTQLFGGRTTPAPAPIAGASRAPVLRQSPGIASANASGSVATGPVAAGSPGFATGGATAGQARQAGGAAGTPARKLPATGLDPALHLEKLASSESIEYAGSGRNIFSADSAPVVIEAEAAPARPGPVGPVTPPPPPGPPAIDLHYFGYAATQDGKRQAFLLHGEDIFEAAPGDIVNHRYKVVSVDIHAVQVTDLSYNNTQSLPLTIN